MLTLPSLLDPRVRLVAACAPRAESRAAFAARFDGARVYPDLEALCADPRVELVYIATPQQLHAGQAVLAAAAGKHLLVEKPLAVELADAERMVAAAESAGVALLVGPSHSFDAPVRLATGLLAGGELGRPRLIQAFNYTDFLYRPRRPEELRTRQGGGVVFSQGAHQIDVARLLAGSPAESVYAVAGSWDPARPTEGAYNAVLRFRGGLSASLVYSGYGRFDSDQWMGWVGELGQPKDPDDYGRARRALTASTARGESETRLKTARTFAAAGEPAPARHHEHFGPVIVVCEHGDLRLTADGVWRYAERREFIAAEPADGAARRGVIDAVVGAVRHGRLPPQTGRWGLATLEICHAILASAASRAPVPLTRQHFREEAHG